jgi:hypothetical protein
MLSMHACIFGADTSCTGLMRPFKHGRQRYNVMQRDALIAPLLNERAS